MLFLLIVIDSDCILFESTKLSCFFAKAIKLPKIGLPTIKEEVPSIGSIIHKYSASI